MFKKNVLMGMLALAFVTLAAGKVRAWDLIPGDPLYGCLDGFCSYEGHVTIRAAKGSSVGADAVTVSMQQVVPPDHAVGFCANPKGKIQKGQAFAVNVTAVQGLGPNGDCIKKGKCSVEVHQVVSTSDLPAVCNDNCPAACTNGQSASDCLVSLFGLDPNTVCQPSQGSTTNNNFSLAAIVWDTVDVTFLVIDSTSTINPVATLTATCTSPAGLSLNQGPFNCVVH
jgi:hypothetical protein